jgi:hypothetical protein
MCMRITEVHKDAIAHCTSRRNRRSDPKPRKCALSITWSTLNSRVLSLWAACAPSTWKMIISAPVFELRQKAHRRKSWTKRQWRTSAKGNAFGTASLLPRSLARGKRPFGFDVYYQQRLTRGHQDWDQHLASNAEFAAPRYWGIQCEAVAPRAVGRCGAPVKSLRPSSFRRNRSSISV